MPFLGKLPPEGNTKVNRAASMNICIGFIAGFHPLHFLYSHFGIDIVILKVEPERR